MARPVLTPVSRLRRHGPALFVLVAGIAFTLAAWRFVTSEIEQEKEERLGRAADELAAGVNERMDAYVSALMGVRGLFVASHVVSRDEFRLYVAALELDRRYPGIQGIGYARRTTPEDVARLESSVRDEGFTTFRVWPRTDGDQYPIVLIEPFDWRNQRAFGYDMHSEPTRRDAMDRARDTALPQLSGTVQLVQETNRNPQPGFLVYLAEYAGPPPETVEGRRRDLRGFVYAPFRAYDLLQHIETEWTRSVVAIDVFDEDNGYAELFHSEPREGGTVRGTTMRQLSILGRHWLLRVSELGPPLEVGERALPIVTLIGGFSIALLFFAVAAMQARARDQAVTSGSRSAFLADTGRALGRSLDESATLATVADLATLALGRWALVQISDNEEAFGHACGPDAPPEAFRGRARSPLSRPRVGVNEPASEVANLATESVPEGWGAQRRLDSMALPLVARGRTLGTLIVAREAGQPYGESDVTLALEFSRMAATALENAQLYRQAREAVAVREEFLGIASHELRTPLTAIRLQLQRALRLAVAIPEGDKLARSLELSDRQARRLTALVDGLLDIARIAHGRLELELEEVDFAAVVKDVAARHSEEAFASGSALHVEADRAVVGRWDRLRLEQIVTNLLSNAIKYGRGRPVRLSVRQRGQTAEMQVADAGIGMSAEATSRIFGRFERAVSARHYGGLGLGLYIVRQIVEALGGTIRVESEEGAGSTFTVELPLSGPAGMEAGRPPTEPLQ